MKDRIWAALAKRAAVAAVTGITLAVVGGGAFIVASQKPDSPPGLENKPVVAASESPGTEVHGGTVERFHGDGDNPCEPPSGTTLEGNWTHGDYVSAWAKSGDPEKTQEAAKSWCGLPQKAVDAKAAKESGGAGASAENRGKGKANKPDDVGTPDGILGS
jgi:hypothetical protein